MTRDEALDLAFRCLVRGAIQKPGELSRLFRYMAERKYKTVLEIGTHVGGTLYAWCQLADTNALLVSVDIPTAAFGGPVPEGIDNILVSYARGQQQIELVRGDSHTQECLDTVKRILGKRRLDLLVIDGDHTYQGVKRDWDWYSPLVKKGGLIVFHDVLTHPDVPESQVDRLWGQLQRTERTVTFADPEPQWGGLGVVVKGD